MNYRSLNTPCKACSVILTEDNAPKNQLKRKTGRCTKCANKQSTGFRKTRNKTLMSQDLVYKDMYSVYKSYSHKVTLFNEQYILPKPSNFYSLPMAVISNMGTGKTQVFLDVIKHFPSKNTQNIVYVTPNKTTIQATADRLRQNDIHHFVYNRYQNGDIGAKAWNSYGGIVLITPDSLHRLHIKEEDVVVIDEVQSIFTDVFQKTAATWTHLKHSEQTFANLLKSYELLRTHKKTVLLDAYISKGVLDVFPFEIKIFRNTYRKKKSLKVYSIEDNPNLRTRFINLILVAIKNQEQIIVQADTVKFLEATQTRINELFPDIKTTIASSTSISNGVTIHQLETGIPLASPAVKLGVSLLSPKIVYIHASGYDLHPYGVFQMCDRARNSTDIHLAVENSKIKPSKSALVQAAEVFNRSYHPFVKLEQEINSQRADYQQFLVERLQENYQLKVNIDSLDSTLYSTIDNELNSIRHNKPENDLVEYLEQQNIPLEVAKNMSEFKGLMSY